MLLPALALIDTQLALVAETATALSVNRDRADQVAVRTGIPRQFEYCFCRQHHQPTVSVGLGQLAQAVKTAALIGKSTAFLAVFR